MRTRLQFVITTAVLCHLFQSAFLLISQARAETPFGQQSPSASEPSDSKMQMSTTEGEPLTIQADRTEQQGNVSTLDGNVEIHFRSYVLHADTVTYDKTSGDATAEGHVSLDGGPHDVHMTATHGTYNIQSRTGKFYDVKGTTGARFKGKNVTLTSSNPVAFSGKVVDKTNEDEYIIQHGTVTSCELPHPKWTFSAARIVIEVGNSAHIYHTVFWLKGVPVIYLPFAAPPVERVGRQSGFMLPLFGTSSTKGTILGDSFYWAINRSMDTTVGGEYFSKRGWALHDVFRARPSDSSFINFDYFGVKDRLGQGGEDIKLSAGAALPYDFRGVASLNYLSSYVFRLAFTENFSQAVNSEVKSIAFASKTFQGFSVNGFASRYQNFQSAQNNGDVVTIFHAPGIELSSVDQRLGGSSLFWSYDAAAEGLRRTQPGFDTPNLVGRFDLEPDLSMPIFIAGWTVRPEIAVRDTLYTEARVPGTGAGTAIQQAVDRRSLETAIELRPPTLGKIFDRTIADRKVKHTIEPYLVYRYNNGIGNFPSIIRFDYRDILSDTNEVEYGLTQRLYLKHAHQDCSPQKSSDTENADKDDSEADKSDFRNCAPAGANEFVTWVVKQKYFFDPNFDGAVVNGVRNVLTTTADFAGIAFLTDPRRFTPLVSTLRMRTTANTDMQWELDYDTKKGRINASTFYTTFHIGDYFLGGSHAYLQVPGEIFVTPPLPDAPTPVPGPSQFNQFRILGGYGNPSKRGLSLAANVGFDSTVSFVQYGAAQAAYNWDCCGISLEYRRFALGVVRNENAFRFAFTLANIGTFGNMRRQERLF